MEVWQACTGFASDGQLVAGNASAAQDAINHALDLQSPGRVATSSQVGHIRCCGKWHLLISKCILCSIAHPACRRKSDICPDMNWQTRQLVSLDPAAASLRSALPCSSTLNTTKCAGQCQGWHFAYADEDEACCSRQNRHISKHRSLQLVAQVWEGGSNDEKANMIKRRTCTSSRA